jgi:cytosine/adenosine deaminase-related metal-dependent hydrolase
MTTIIRGARMLTLDAADTEHAKARNPICNLHLSSGIMPLRGRRHRHWH